MNKVLIKNTVIPQAPPYYLTLSTRDKITELSAFKGNFPSLLTIRDLVNLKGNILYNWDFYFTFLCQEQIIHTCLNDLYYLV